MTVNKKYTSMKTKNLTSEQLQKAFRYYSIGLNSHEIAKLLDCSYRTIQNYMSAEKWKEKKQSLKNDCFLLGGDIGQG